jgi:VWFA-related protein
MTRLRLLRTTLVVAFAVEGVITGTFAQSGRVRERPRPENGQTDAVNLQVEEVLLPVSVHTNSGSPPGTLLRSDFAVIEDGKRQSINSVIRTPSNIVFLLDAGGDSVHKNINANRDLALKMIEALGPEDQAAIVTYSDRVSLLSSWTKDKKALRQALHWRFRPGLTSEFYAGLLFCAEEVLARVSGRRSIVLMTDGVDTFDNTAFERSLGALHRSRATLYVVSQGSVIMDKLKPQAFNPLVILENRSGRARVERMRAYYKQLEAAELTLKGLAEETGGAAWCPLNMNEFALLDREILSELNTEYILAYQTERPAEDAFFHSTKVISNNPDLRVRCRRGVYSTTFRPEAKGGTAPVVPKPKSAADSERRPGGDHKGSSAAALVTDAVGFS